VSRSNNGGHFVIATAAGLVALPAAVVCFSKFDMAGGSCMCIGVNLFGYAPGQMQRPKSCSLMAVFKLADEHPLTKAGLRCVHLVETAARGLRVGDLVFEFPFGHIVDTGMACRRDGIVPPGLDLMAVHKEASAVRASRQRATSGSGGRKHLTLQAGGLGHIRSAVGTSA
jgi:hypothetical protein